MEIGDDKNNFYNFIILNILFTWLSEVYLIQGVAILQTPQTSMLRVNIPVLTVPQYEEKLIACAVASYVLGKYHKTKSKAPTATKLTFQSVNPHSGHLALNDDDNDFAAANEDELHDDKPQNNFFYPVGQNIVGTSLTSTNDIIIFINILTTTRLFANSFKY